MSVLDRFRGRSYSHRHDDDHYADEPVATRHAVRAHQHDEFGGTNWGAAFFGWLVAVGLGALLTAFLSAAGAAIALSELETVGQARGEAETIGLVGGIALLVVAVVSYFAGGYVAGRMSRFDGGRQGLAVWIWSIVVVIVLAVIGAVAGEEYNLFAALDLPRIPIEEGDLTTGGVIALLAIAIGTALAAIAGGKAGEAYHRRIDRVGFERTADEREAAARDRAEAARDREETAEPRDERRGPHPA